MAFEFCSFMNLVYSDTPSIIGALVAVLLLLLIAGGIFWYVKGRKTNLSNVFNTSGDRSFSNPFFNQEVTMSHLQQVRSIKSFKY